MKITIDVKEDLHSALVSFSQLTGSSVNTLYDEALQDYVALVLSARMENFGVVQTPTNLLHMGHYLN